MMVVIGITLVILIRLGNISAMQRHRLISAEERKP
jgi:hypothetical protein